MTTPIRLVASDMDGTLLDSRKQPPADFAAWVLAHPEIVTVLASGRQFGNLYAVLPEIADRLYYISEGGAFVFRNQTLLCADAMSKEGLHALLRFIDALPDAYPILCNARRAYMRRSPAVVEHNAHLYYADLCFTEDLHTVIDETDIGKTAIFIDHQQAEVVYHQLPTLYDGFRAVLSGVDWIDVINDSVNKGSAIRFLQQRLGISPDSCMAFGDYLNDCELLTACTESYAMANAHPELLRCAKYQTDTNDNDGVMKVLRQISQ